MCSAPFGAYTTPVLSCLSCYHAYTMYQPGRQGYHIYVSQVDRGGEHLPRGMLASCLLLCVPAAPLHARPPRPPQPCACPQRTGAAAVRARGAAAPTTACEWLAADSTGRATTTRCGRITLAESDVCGRILLHSTPALLQPCLAHPCSTPMLARRGCCSTLSWGSRAPAPRGGGAGGGAVSRGGGGGGGGAGGCIGRRGRRDGLH